VDTSKTRLNEPLIEPLTKPRSDKGKAKRREKEELSKIAREFGFKREYNWCTYEEQGEEEREQIKQNVIKRITKKRQISPTFRKYEKRLRNKQYYLKQGRVKICTHCNITKSLGEFDYLRDKKKGKYVFRPYCIDCRKEMNRKYWAKYKKDKHDSV